MSPSAAELASRLTAVFTRRDEDGRLAHADEAISGLVPLIYLEIARADPDAALPDEARAALIAWLLPAGEVPSEAELTARIEARLADPGVKQLQAEVEQALREALAERPAEEGGLAAFMGESRTRAALMGERPTGTTAAGPLARFILRDGGKPRSG